MSRRSRRKSHPPRGGSEAIEVRTEDGWSLRADVHEPAVQEAEVAGVVLLAHAMMARRTEFERPRDASLIVRLLARGWRVVNFDFRGHGDSGPPARDGASYGYDDFVTGDLPVMHEFARSRLRRRKPVVLLGHSLGGHVALAAQGIGRVSFDGIACVGANVWLRSLEPSPARWAVKRAALATIAAVSRRVGRFPARALRMGSDDESRVYFDDFERFARTGLWTSADGRHDYLAALKQVRVPVLQMVSEGDRMACVAECGERFTALCGGGHEVLRLSRGDDGGPPPDHMGMVTSGRVGSAWERVEAWMGRLRVALP